MIVSASYKTDIPAFYGAWFGNRLAAGGCWVRNPWNGRRFFVDLRPESVDGFVFWTKNLRPFMAPLAVAAERWPFVVQLTITGYRPVLEASVVAAERSIADAVAVNAAYGPGRVVWRYDPIIVSSITSTAWHRATFARLAAALTGVVDEVVVSFVQRYRKTERNLNRALLAEGATWRDPPVDEKRQLLAELATVAADYGIHLTLCAQPDLVTDDLAAAKCIDLARLSDIAGKPIGGREKGNRPGCACAESRDIGAYDSCPHGCVYCYAVANQSTAKARFRCHDRAAQGL